MTDLDQATENQDETKQEFEIGQTFIDTYPPEAAIWCNESQKAYITELDRNEKGLRVFQIVKVPDPTPEQLLQMAKNERASAVSKIVVEVDGMLFDGDETAQSRMSRTISAAVATEADLGTKRTWVLADNTIAQVTIKQLAQALELAGNEMTKLWTVPYEEAKSTKETAESETKNE